MHHLFRIKYHLLLEMLTDSESALECNLNTVYCCVSAVTLFIWVPWSTSQNSLTVFEKLNDKFPFPDSDPGTKLEEKWFKFSLPLLCLEEACITAEKLPVSLYISWIIGSIEYSLSLCHPNAGVKTIIFIDFRDIIQGSFTMTPSFLVCFVHIT